MAIRQNIKAPSKIEAKTAPDQGAPEAAPQRLRPDRGQFRLQVDRQTKSSYDSYEAAGQAGLAIKRGYPILQVSIYDTVQGVNTILELPEA